MWNQKIIFLKLSKYFIFAELFCLSLSFVNLVPDLATTWDKWLWYNKYIFCPDPQLHFWSVFRLVWTSCNLSFAILIYRLEVTRSHGIFILPNWTTELNYKFYLNTDQNRIGKFASSKIGTILERNSHGEFTFMPLTCLTKPIQSNVHGAL